MKRLTLFRGNCNINSEEKNGDHKERVRGVYGVKEILNIHKDLLSAIGAAKGDIQKKKYNHKKSKSNLNICANIGKIHSYSFSASANPILSAGFFRSQQNHSRKKQNKNHKQGIGDRGTGKKFLNIHKDLLLSVSQRLNSNPTIASGKLYVNNALYSFNDVPNNPGLTNKSPIHADVKLIDIEPNTSKNAFLENKLINYNLIQMNTDYKFQTCHSDKFKFKTF